MTRTLPCSARGVTCHARREPPRTSGPRLGESGSSRRLVGDAPEPEYGAKNGYEGTIDELRIATVARTSGWIATEYANQSSPATFYTVGPEQTP